MAMNRVQFQRGLSMARFLKQCGAVEQCHAALVASRWPTGFVCSHCGETQHSTIFQATKLPLTLWFLAMHLCCPGEE